jgi:glycosyltransferase involved in cell wall biosynthesis
MKIRIILSHPASYLFGEVREAVVALDLARLGHDVRIFRVHDRPAPKHEVFRDTVPVTYFPADDPAATPHNMVSSALLDALHNDQPDTVLFKGLGYDIVSRVLEREPPGWIRTGFILGGTAVDPALARADFVFAESHGQIAEIHRALERPLPCCVLAKYIDWNIADQLYAERQSTAPEFDIVNVGTFEPRKNQIALRAFFGRHRVALVGSGEMQTAVAEAAAGYSNVHLLGALPNAATLGVVARSRLMVHASLWEGVPRAVFEALACGTPVVAHGFAIQEKFEDTRAVRLVGQDELVPTVEALLADTPLLTAMAADGRAFARDLHGPQRLAEAARHILAMASPS